MEYLDLLKKHKDRKPDAEILAKIPVTFLSNITVNSLKEYLEYFLAENQIEVDLTFGDYDNITQDAENLVQEKDVVVVVWEAANLINGLEYKLESFNASEFNQLIEKTQFELQQLFTALSPNPLVLFNGFTAKAFDFNRTEKSKLELLCDILNNYVQENMPKGFRIIDVDKILIENGIKKSVDYRNYFRNKALYKHEFFLSYTQHVVNYLKVYVGHVNKALILDCDNTLWNGVLGEDGFDGIKMDSNELKGIPFAAAQYRAKALAKEGVLVALASKNNPEDVNEVLEKHKSIVLQDEHLVAKLVNWNPKPENLKGLVETLNIGADSMLFVDDSDFENDQMKQYMPAVKLHHVSKKGVEYYASQNRWFNLFLKLAKSKEDSKKLEQYRANFKRAESESQFKDYNDFLSSLGLKMTIFKNKASLVDRMAQMTQKTNQFNLTTRRYTVADIDGKLKSNAFDLYAFELEDKFGSSGVTGLSIVDKSIKELDTFLMSCRVLGRKAEIAFAEAIIEDQLKELDQIKAKYLKTKKNAQVEDFYEKLGFTLVSSEAQSKCYQLIKEDFRKSNIEYLSLNYEY